MRIMTKMLLLMMTGVVTLLSCTKDITFSGKETTPRLVIYSLARSGSPLVVQLSHSAFFLEGNTRNFYRIYPSRGKVELYVNYAEEPYILTPREPAQTGVDDNGNPVYETLPVAPIHYLSDYVVQPGDHLRLVASFLDFAEAEAEIDVPVCPQLTVDRVEVKHPEYSHSDFVLNLSLTKGADPEYYYRIRPKVSGQYTETDGKTVNLHVEEKIFSNDILFMSTSYSFEDVMDLVLSDKSQLKQDQVFADSSIPYSPYSFQCSYGTTPPEYVQERGGSSRYYLIFTTISRDLYRYMTSYAAVRNATMMSQLTETPVLYSNVKGGLGCFCAYTSVEIELGI